MRVRAGLQFKPGGEILSSTVSVIGSGLFRSAPATGHRVLMSCVSSSPTCCIAAAVAKQSCCVSRHSICNWRAEDVHIVPSVCAGQSVGSCQNVTLQCRLRCFSRPNPAATITSSSQQCFWQCVLPTSRSIWQGWAAEHGALISTPEFLNWSTVKNCGTAQNCRTVSGVSVLPRSSSFRVRNHSGETWEEFGSRKRFHTAARQEGRYICAAISEECTFENWVEIHEESVIGKESEAIGNDIGDPEDSKIILPEIWVVNFYHFVCIEDPHLEVSRHTSFLEGRDVRGRIYISHQGINAQLSGPGNKAMEYAEWVKEDPRFSNMLVQISPSSVGHTFPRLRLRYKPSLVQVEGGTLHLPITDPSARAVHLTPREWTARLTAATVFSNNDTTFSQELEDPKNGFHHEKNMPTANVTRPVVLLDVRNGYEWDVGHFKGAKRPDVDCFKNTEFGLTEKEPVSRDPLANVDKENVDVMMYCTGGIRCDVFSTMLRQKGFKNLYTLKGGVSNYLKEEGGRCWAGNLFVFDSRLAVPPKAYHGKELPEQVENLEHDATEETDYASSSAIQLFARCRLCGDPISEPRHRNCANLDCNLLYMSCEECLPQHKGCCSQSCSLAPNLRPLLDSHQYDRWHNYRPQEPKPAKPPDYVSRRALKRRRRKERRKQLIRETTSEQLNVQVL